MDLIIRCGSKELHPLENPVILDLIFERCPFKDLQTCRLVSKLWYNTSNKTWRALARAEIFSWKQGRTMSNFLEFMESNDSIYIDYPPFNNYTLGDTANRFWYLCGPNITVLQLHGIKFHSVYAFRNAVFESCPNIEHLDLQRVTVSGDSEKTFNENEWRNSPNFEENWNLKSLKICQEDGNLGGVTWFEVLSHFPGLEAVTLTGWLRSLGELFKSINLIRKDDPKKLSLKYFHTEHDCEFDNIPEEFTHILMDSRLRLHSVSICLCVSELSSVLRHFDSSMTKLNVYLGEESA